MTDLIPSSCFTTPCLPRRLLSKVEAVAILNDTANIQPTLSHHRIAPAYAIDRPVFTIMYNMAGFACMVLPPGV